MTDKVVTLRIVGENGQLVATVKSSTSELDKLGRSAQAAGAKGSAGLDQVGQSAQRGKRDVDAMSGSVGSLTKLLGGLGVVAMARSLGSSFVAAADRAGQLEARVRNATETQREYEYVLERSGQVAHTTYQSINTVAEIAINAAGPMRQLGYSVRDTLDLTEAMSLSLVASAANQQRSTATIDQFSKAMQVGVLRGEAFNSVLQNAPEFVAALERALGKTRAEIIEMANSGQLTVGELTKVASEIQTLTDKVEAMPTTVEDAWIRFGDVFQAQAKRLNEASGATGVLVTGIELLAASIGPLVTVAGLAAVAIGGRMVAAFAAKGAAVARDIQASRVAAAAELQSARAAEAHALALANRARAGLGSAGALAAAEANLAAATARTEAAMRASSIATIAKARAMQTLNTAMAAFGGPVGLAITALTLFVLWVRNSAKEARELAETVKQGFQEALTTFQEFNRETANESFAGLASGMEKLDQARELVELLEEKERKLSEQRARQIAQYGQALGSVARQHAETVEELEMARLKLSLLEPAVADTVNAYAGLVLEAAGVANASEAQRAATESVIDSLGREGITLEQGKPKLIEHTEATYGLEAANRLAAASFRDLADAANFDWSDVDKTLNQMIDRATQGYIEATQGKAAAARAALEKALLEDGGAASDPEGAQRRRELLEVAIALEAQTDKLTEARKRGVAASRQAEQETKRLTAAQASNAAEVERQIAQLEGPLKAAEYDRDARLKQLSALLKEGAISQQHHDLGQQAAREQYRRTTKEIRAQQDVMGKTAADYREAIGLFAMSASARRVEEEVIRRVADAKRAGRQLTAAEISDLRRYIAEQERVLDVMELQAASAQRYERMWNGAIDSVARAFGDWTLNVRTQYEDLGDALKDITRRFLSDIVAEFARDSVLRPIRAWFSQLMSGGFAQAGGTTTNAGGFLASLFGGGNGGGGGIMAGLAQAVRGWFGGTAAGPQAAGLAQPGAGAGLAFGYMPAAVGAIGSGGAGGAGGLIEIGGQFYSLAGTKTGGAFLQSAAAPWLAGAAGAAYGWNQGGDTAGKTLGAAAYGAAGYGVMAGVGGAMAGSAVAGSAAAGLAAVPVVGWIALAAIAIDKLSGGKLFGTKFKSESASMDLAFGADGASGSTTLTEVRNRSLFRGRKWRTTVEDLDPEAQTALDEAWSAINDSVAQAAAQLGVATPDLIAGSFRQEFDGKGNLQREFATIAGRVYNEAEEAFTQRLVAENLLNVAGQVGNRAELDRIAERFRGSPEDLTEFATLALAMQADIKNAAALWDSTVAGSFDRIVRSMEKLGQGSEQLAETYARLTGTAREYGVLIGDVRGQLATADLNDYQRAQLDIELGYRNQVRQANELAKALGLSGARAEDLAAIEELRALNMATLQRQQEAQRDTWLQDLGLSDLSTLRDDQKLSESMQLLRDAVGAGDLQRAQQLGQTALGFGRSLYASGADYAGLYDQVTGLIEGMTPGDELGFDDVELTRIADLLEDLPQRLATEVFAQVLAPPPAPITPWTPPVPATPPGSGGAGGSSSTDRLLQQMLERLAAIEAHTSGQLQQTSSGALDARLNGTRQVAR